MIGRIFCFFAVECGGKDLHVRCDSGSLVNLDCTSALILPLKNLVVAVVLEVAVCFAQIGLNGN